MATLGEKSVGSIVKLKVNGVATNFIVVHQGRPSSTYDSSCDGTWLLMKDLYAPFMWDSQYSDYANSDVHSYLNNTFFNLLDSDIKSVIKQVKIPYTKGYGASRSLQVGSNGLSTKVFLISTAEIISPLPSEVHAEGSVLSYFNGADASKRVGYYNGGKEFWWLRSPYVYSVNAVHVWYVRLAGQVDDYAYCYYDGANGYIYIRPALIMPSNLLVDDAGSVTSKTASAFSGYANIGGVNKELKGGYVNIGGTWKEVSGMHMNIGGTWKEMA